MVSIFKLLNNLLTINQTIQLAVDLYPTIQEYVTIHGKLILEYFFFFFC